MLKATDDRSSHIKNSKKKKVILLNCCTLTYDDVQRYSDNFFYFCQQSFYLQSLLYVLCGSLQLTRYVLNTLWQLQPTSTSQFAFHSTSSELKHHGDQHFSDQHFSVNKK